MTIAVTDHYYYIKNQTKIQEVFTKIFLFFIIFREMLFSFLKTFTAAFFNKADPVFLDPPYGSMEITCS